MNLKKVDLIVVIQCLVDIDLISPLTQEEEEELIGASS